MPKKLGLNSKAVEARERKNEAKKLAQDRKEREIEDAKWVDDDKNAAKKKQRKEEEERKKAELLRRKLENKKLLEEETVQVTPVSKQSIQKITRQQVQEEMERKNRNVEKMMQAKVPARINTDGPVLEENLNRSMADTVVASNVDEALAALSMTEKDDLHPEKRMRAAYRAFEDVNLPRIKAENPSLRMSQWKQMLMKEWNKSPDNPFNQK